MSKENNAVLLEISPTGQHQRLALLLAQEVPPEDPVPTVVPIMLNKTLYLADPLVSTKNGHSGHHAVTHAVDNNHVSRDTPAEKHLALKIVPVEEMECMVSGPVIPPALNHAQEVLKREDDLTFAHEMHKPKPKLVERLDHGESTLHGVCVQEAAVEANNLEREYTHALPILELVTTVVLNKKSVYVVPKSAATISITVNGLHVPGPAATDPDQGDASATAPTVSQQSYKTNSATFLPVSSVNGHNGALAVNLVLVELKQERKPTAATRHLTKDSLNSVVLMVATHNGQLGDNVHAAAVLDSRPKDELISVELKKLKLNNNNASSNQQLSDQQDHGVHAHRLAQVEDKPDDTYITAVYQTGSNHRNVVTQAISESGLNGQHAPVLAPALGSVASSTNVPQNRILKPKPAEVVVTTEYGHNGELARKFVLEAHK